MKEAVSKNYELSPREIADKILNGEIETCWICGLIEPHSNAECQAEYEAKLMAEDKNKIPFAWCG